MQTIVAQLLTPQAFAPFGDVLEAPEGFGRLYFDAALGNLSDTAAPSLYVSKLEPLNDETVVARVMERHEFSSQSFLPLDVDRYLVLVAPQALAGGPDVFGMQAFVGRGTQGITYRPDTWHHPMTVFGRAATFAVMMWRDGSSADEEFTTLAQPLQVTISASLLA